MTNYTVTPSHNVEYDLNKLNINCSTLMMQLKPWQSILQEKHKWNLKHYTIPLISKGNLQNIQVFQTHNETPQVLYILS